MWISIVKSFVELSKYLLNIPELKGKYILSEHFCQDSVENYFGQLRSRGGWCENPTIKSCLTSAQSLRIQGSMAMMCGGTPVERGGYLETLVI